MMFFAALLRRPHDRSFGTASSTARAGGTFFSGANHRTVFRPVKRLREPRSAMMQRGRLENPVLATGSADGAIGRALLDEDDRREQTCYPSRELLLHRSDKNGILPPIN